MILFKILVWELLVLIWLIFLAILAALICTGVLRICIKIFEWIEKIIYKEE